MIVTGIGSRETPDDILRGMRILGRFLASEGHILRSGGATGADSAFEEGWKLSSGKMEIYLPWDGFEKKRGGRPGYFSNMPDLPILEEYVTRFHPKGEKLQQSFRKLMKRNCYQILGYDLNTKTDLVIMFAPEIKKDSFGKIKNCSGGTGFAVRMAYEFGIPIFSMGIPAHVRYLAKNYLSDRTIREI